MLNFANVPLFVSRIFTNIYLKMQCNIKSNKTEVSEVPFVTSVKFPLNNLTLR